MRLEVREQVQEIADGAQYTFWTFGGTVPGPMIRVRRGDLVELHLMNHPRNMLAHSIDLHAATGPGGGAASTFTAPGHQTQFTFQALNAGVYVYHCAAAPVGMHIANGLYGLIVVEPEEGYPPVDREYYVVQGDFYTSGNYRDPGLQTFDMQRAIDENPSYVVFNGRDGALTGERALTANVGETVRIFVGNGGPNLVSSFHVIGEIFDRVYREGALEPVHNLQTTLVPAGGSAIVDLHFDAPGNFTLVDHSIFRAFHKGALGTIRVAGSENHTVYSGPGPDQLYAGSDPPGAPEPPPAAPAEAPAGPRGEGTYTAVCTTCHQRAAQGVASVFPPLARSDYLLADRERAIRVVLAGLSGPIEVLGRRYNAVMPAFGDLSDREVADVLTYVRGNFGNRDDAITQGEVADVRAHLRTTARTARH